MNLIQQLEQEQIAKLAKTIPDFQPGDTVIVNVKVKEGERTRVQAYEGVCIARSGGGLHESFTVRKISYGEGVERVFPLYSPHGRFHQGRAPRRRPPRQALLPARPSRQVGPYRRAHREEDRDPGRRRVRLSSPSADFRKRGSSRAFLLIGASVAARDRDKNIIARRPASAMRSFQGGVRSGHLPVPASCR